MDDIVPGSCPECGGTRLKEYEGGYLECQDCWCLWDGPEDLAKMLRDGDDPPRCKECGMVIGVNCRHRTDVLKDYHPNDLIPAWT